MPRKMLFDDANDAGFPNLCIIIVVLVFVTICDVSFSLWGWFTGKKGPTPC